MAKVDHWPTPSPSTGSIASSILVLAAAFFLGSLPAPSARAESLQEAMGMAYDVNPGLKAQRSRLEAVNEGIWQARSQFLPTITGTYLAEHNAFRSGRTGNSDRAFFHELGVTLSQPIFQGFSAVHRLNQAHEESESGRNQLIGTEQNLLFDTATAYFRVLRDQAILRYLKEYAGIVAEEKNAASARYRSGDATLTDIEQAAARLAEAQGNRDLAKGDLDAAIAAYERYTGKQPGKLRWPKVPKSIRPKDLMEAVDIASRNNPQIRAATADARAARYAARASVGDILPRVDLEGTWENGYRGNLGNRDEEDFRLGIRVTAPIFTGGRNISSVRQAKFTATQEEYELDDIRLAVRENVIRAVKTEKAAKNRAAAARRAITSNQRAVRGLRVEFESGQRSLLNVLDGQKELATSQVDFARAEYDAYVAEFFLLASIGRLNPDHFAIPAERPEIVARYVPELNDWELRLEAAEFNY